MLDAYDSLKRADGTTLTYAPNPIQTTGDTSLRGTGDTPSRLAVDRGVR